MEQWRAGNPVVAGGVTLVPVEHWRFEYDVGSKSGWLHGLKEPWAIVVCDGSGVRAFTAQGASIPVAFLVLKVPALRALLSLPV